MLIKLRILAQLTKQMGLQYVLYRIWHELSRRLGFLRFKFPQNPFKKKFIALADWRNNAPAFFFIDRQDVRVSDFQIDKNRIDRILNGEICFFGHQWISLGKDYDWVLNPHSGYKYNPNRHWLTINELSAAAGDIKYVWEKSRFCYLYEIIRYDQSSHEDHSDFVMNEIAHWINHNPTNSGPNWVCSQEISLRLLNWTFALYYYRNSNALTDRLFTMIMHSIYWQLKHVYNHINFSRIAVRNNHAVTETLCLYVAGLLFPFFPEAKTWKRKGKDWFEKEIEYQIYKDGTYLQFSMNYHRVVVQLLSWAISLSLIHHEPLNKIVLDRAYKSLDFLLQCQELRNGYLPNYGANDGALFFPLSSCDGNDFRPALNTLHRLLTGADLYERGNWLEESQWIVAGRTVQDKFPVLKQRLGTSKYEYGGYYLYRDQDSLSFIRCGKHRNRPSQADNLHFDLWYKGENILHDSGSYLYNTDPNDANYFMGTSSHNTIMLNNQNQMERGGRFIWLNWSQAVLAEVTEDDRIWAFLGQIKAFKQEGKNIIHQRKIVRNKFEPIWIVEDTLMNLPENTKVSQRWNSNFFEKMSITFNEEDQAKINAWKETGFYSRCYGEKLLSTCLVAETKSSTIKTNIAIR